MYSEIWDCEHKCKYEDISLFFRIINKSHDKAVFQELTEVFKRVIMHLHSVIKLLNQVNISIFCIQTLLTLNKDE